MNFSPPISSVHGIFQARILKWVAVPFSRGSSQPRNWTCVLCAWMREFDYKESWVQKNWCFLTVVLDKTPGSPLDCKEIQPVHPQGDQSWMFIGRTDVETETPIFWPPDVKSSLIWKDPDAGKDWRQEGKRTPEDEMVRWLHQLDGHGFGWTQGADDGQGGLVCCGSWGCKELDMTERLHWIELLCILHWQASSLLLVPPGQPLYIYIYIYIWYI